MISNMIKLERQAGFALLRMDDGKANAINAGFLSEFSRALDDCSRPEASPLLLTGRGDFFSAGLDLPGLSTFDRPGIEAIERDLVALLRRLFCWPAPVVAAVNGHAIAGGCILALQADWRAMARGPFKIGVNETRLGLGLPAFVLETLRVQIPTAALRRVALEGPLLEPEQALGLGLVDELAAAESLRTRARERLQELSAIPRPSYAQVKGMLRRPAVEAYERTRAEDTRLWIDLWFSPAGSALREETVARLKAKREEPQR
jgi:enoyl-CoA hydratase